VNRRRPDRRTGWLFRADRCGFCGWYTSTVGQHDPAYVGHHPLCPERLYAGLHTAEGIADQWQVLCEWARLDGLGAPGWAEYWQQLAEALMERAEQLGVPFPVPDDARELAGRAW
jgi:hypothetical protein